jgi:hypothetical protein
MARARLTLSKVNPAQLRKRNSPIGLLSLPLSVGLFECLGPKSKRRPVDVNDHAVMIAKIATGAIENVPSSPESEGKKAATVALGRMGGKAPDSGHSPKASGNHKKAAKVSWAD